MGWDKRLLQLETTQGTGDGPRRVAGPGYVQELESYAWKQYPLISEGVRKGGCRDNGKGSG